MKIIIVVDGVYKNGSIKFTYFGENAFTSKSIYTSTENIKLYHEYNYRTLNKIEKKIIKECYKKLNGKKSFIDNKSYSFRNVDLVEF